MPPSSPWCFPSLPSRRSSPSSRPLPSPRPSPRAVAAVAGAACALAACPVLAQGASRLRQVAALDPASAALAWPVGIAAGAAAMPAPTPAPSRPPSAPAPAPASPAAPLRWEVRTQDITLSRTLERWAAQAGYRLKWDAARNFLIGASDVYQGGFEDALQAVLGSAGIRGSDYPLEACIYANTPPLVRITRQGEQSRECHAS